MIYKIGIIIYAQYKL